MKKWTGFFLVASSGIGFGFMGSFARLAGKWGVNIFTLLSFRFLIAFLILFTILALSKKEGYLGFQKFILVSLLGILGYAVMAYLLFSSYKLVPVSIATIIFYSYPILTYCISILGKQDQFKFSKVLILLFCFFGLFICVFSGGTIKPTGILFAFGAGVIYSIFIVISNTFLKDVPSILSSTIICLASGMTLFLIGSSTHQISMRVSMGGWLMISSLALISTVIPIVSFFNGVKLIGATNSAIVSILEPITSILLAVLLFHDVLKSLQMLGITIAITSILVSQLIEVNYRPRIFYNLWKH